MKKFWIQITVLTLVIFGGFYFYSNPSSLNTFFPGSAPAAPLTELKIGENTLKVEIADTPDKRAQGLGGRETLATDSGMLFEFSSAQKYVFWMKGMKIPLDFIYINDGKVVDMLKNIQPPAPDQPDADLPRLSPSVEINMVLEVNAGFIDLHNIKNGDSVLLVK